MGYLHIGGAAFSAGGSRFNPTEARTIAAWLTEQRAPLEQHYSEKLEDILAIVTPFGQQAQTPGFHVFCRAYDHVFKINPLPKALLICLQERLKYP